MDKIFCTIPTTQTATGVMLSQQNNNISHITVKVSSNKISDNSKFWNDINFIGIRSNWCYNNPIESYKCDNIRCEDINLDFNRCDNIIDSCRFDSKTDSSSIGSGDNFIGNSKKTDNRWQQH